jgi:16S rRNA G966 N2-methylase RsmD
MDRVKAAIFSSLGDKVIGARVLDLFAGSGGLGIEALSRGAATALFIDDQRQAITVGAAEDAPAPRALRRDQPAAVIEAQRAQREAEFLGKLGDGEFGFFRSRSTG